VKRYGRDCKSRPAKKVLSLPSLYSLLAWLSPSFPIGAYTYSHGLEYAVESGLVKDRASLVEWVETIITAGTGRTDAMLFCAAYRAEDAEQLAWVVERADALRGTASRHWKVRLKGKPFWTRCEPLGLMLP